MSKVSKAGPGQKMKSSHRQENASADLFETLESTASSSEMQIPLSGVPRQNTSVSDTLRRIDNEPKSSGSLFGTYINNIWKDLVVMLSASVYSYWGGPLTGIRMGLLSSNRRGFECLCVCPLSLVMGSSGSCGSSRLWGNPYVTWSYRRITQHWMFITSCKWSITTLQYIYYGTYTKIHRYYTKRYFLTKPVTFKTQFP